MSFLHTHSSECIKSELDLFSLPPTQTSIESSQWIYYKPVTLLAHRIHHIRTWRRLSGPHSHHVEPSYTRRKRARGEHVGRARWRGKSRPRKSFIAFHVQPNRRIFQSKARIATKQRLRVPRVHRGVIKLCFTRKNLPSNLLLMERGYFWLRGRHVRLVKSKYSARETRAIHSRKSRSRSHWSSSLRRFQSR